MKPFEICGSYGSFFVDYLLGCDMWQTCTDISDKSGSSIIMLDYPHIYPDDGGSKFI
jgi:hypothetical protein